MKDVMNRFSCDKMMANANRNSAPKDPRIPMAWRHREMTFSPCGRRQSSPSVTSSSSDDRDEVRHHYRPLSRNSNAEERMDHYATIRHEERKNEHFLSARNEPFVRRPVEGYFNAHYRNSGTLRSTRSVPSLLTIDSCPIHGGNHGSMRRHGSLYDMRASPIVGPLNLGQHRKTLHGSKLSLLNSLSPPPFHHQLPQYIPHMINRQHLGLPMIVQSIPMRDPLKNMHNEHYKDPIDPYSVEQVCCKGHLIVLWIILGVVTVGVILGIIMGVTIT